MVVLFKSLIRPLLEYGQSIWSPHLLKQSRLIENVQRRATKLIHTIKDLPYRKRLEHLRLPSLKYRRLRGDLIQVYNLFKTDSFHKFFTLSTHDNTRGHDFKIYKKHSRTNTRKHSFSNRIVNTWNNLPHHTV